MPYFIGTDIGTSGTKTILIDNKGNLKAKSVVEYPLYHPKPGWAEQNPEDWWKATVESIRKVVRESGVPKAEIKGIGLSGQMHGTVFLDKNNNVIRPAILWCDQRTAKQCNYITETIGKKRLIQLTCNPALTGFSAPKIVWLRQNEPKNYARIAKILLPKDYIRFRLSGIFATEVSDASGTLLFDVKNRKWSNKVLDKLNISLSWLPDAYESYKISCNTLSDVSDELGIPNGSPIAGGGGDQAAGGVGNGIVREGIISTALGTSGVVFASTNSPKLDAQARIHTFCHAVPKTWHIMGVMLSAGGSFQWFRNVLGREEMAEAKQKGVDPYVILDAKASTAPVGSEGLIFLPYLTGERTPYPDPDARATFFGISPRHKKEHLTRAVMEGVTYGLRDSLELIRGMGIKIKQIRASGGGARSALWRQMQADVFNSPVVRIDKDEGPAFGVALLATVGTGYYSSVAEACDATINIKDETNPVQKNVKIYNDYYSIYKNLYKSLKNDFSRTARIVEKYVK